MNKIEELLELLEVEPIEDTIFRAQSRNVVGQRVFGGQVLAQALNAAIHTVPADRFVHSLHGYFILPGDVNQPIVYDVDTIRDGGSFTTRRVVAIQKGRAIFNMSASFQVEQEGFEHQIPMINVPPPESLMDDAEFEKAYKDKLPRHFRRGNRPIEFRRVERFDPLNPTNQPPLQHIWIRAKGAMPDDKTLHQVVLAYASDYSLLATALLPHQEALNFEELQMASLDHAMWFHRDFRMDDWLLYASDSPSMSNTRGFTRGNIFTRDGKLNWKWVIENWKWGADMDLSA